MTSAEIAFYAANEALYDGLTCDYTRCGKTVFGVPVNRGRTILVDETLGGARIENPSNDFIVPRRRLHSLAAEGVAFTPKKGDTITIEHSYDEDCDTYEVMTPPYSPHDHDGHLFRAYKANLPVSDSVVSIRNMVVAAIGTSGLTPVLQVEETYDAALDLNELKGGRLIVVPQTLLPRLASRQADQEKKCKIDLTVQYKTTTAKRTEIDPYLSLAESLSDYFLGFRFTTPIPLTTPQQMRNVGACLETAFPHGLWVVEHMAEFGVFTSVITLTITYAK